MPAIVNTELAAGLKEARGLKNLEPEEVADAIVNALESPRFDVWVPRSTQFISTVTTLVPRRGREAIARFFKADKVLAEADPAQRVAYEERAAHSEPGLEPEDLGAKR
jgi:short-subunit dehydrogenase